MGSEEGVGWGVARALARNHRVHVLTTPRCRASIERYMTAHPCEQLSFSYHDCSPWILRSAVTSALWQVYYHIWQCQTASWARPIAAEFEPDVVHHITYARYWTPCSLYKLGRPLVWGPLGGGDSCPVTFRDTLTLKERVSAMVRDFAQWLARLDPMLRATARHASVALGLTNATEDRLRELGSPHAMHCFQNAVDHELTTGPLTEPEGTLFCSAGRLLGWKGHALTLRAFARLRTPHARLVIIGEGPTRSRLMALGKELDISDRLQLLGAVPHDEALSWIQRSTALVHSSFHDQAPTVVFEAMAVGTPVIGLQLGGVVHQITPETGMPVAARTPDQAEVDIAAAMQQLIENPALRTQLAVAGRQRIQQRYTWTCKAEEFASIYDDALQRFVPEAGASRTLRQPPRVAAWRG